ANHPLVYVLVSLVFSGRCGALTDTSHPGCERLDAPAPANNHKSTRSIEMKKSLLALTLLALPALAVSTAASAAEGVSYNYVEGGYSATNLDKAPDSDGWGLNGSVAIAPNFHVFGSYNQQDFK